MPDPSLLTMFDEVRGKTLRLIDGISQADALWTPDGTDNPILWHAGHIFCVVETLCAHALDPTDKIPATIPPGWFAAFGWGSKPETDSRESWPPIDQVAAHLRAQHTRLRETLSALTDAQLSAPPQEPARLRILHALHDEALHGGEMKLLRKMREHARQTT